MSTDQYIRVSALLTEEQIAALKRHGKSKGVGMAAVIRWAVDEFSAPFFLTTNSFERNVHHDEYIPDAEAHQQHVGEATSTSTN